MIIGIPKEIKNNENRVGLTPAGVQEFVKRGHDVFVQASAGENSGFPDSAYEAVGARILPTIVPESAREGTTTGEVVPRNMPAMLASPNNDTVL